MKLFNFQSFKASHSTCSRLHQRLQDESRLRELIQVTKIKNLASKIVISLATKSCDEKKLNLKVNTVNFLFNEPSLEKDCNFSDNGNLGNNGLVRAKFMADDGYHLSDDGVKVLASSLLKSLEHVLNIEVLRNGQRRSSGKLSWQKRFGWLVVLGLTAL